MMENTKSRVTALNCNFNVSKCSGRNLNVICLLLRRMWSISVRETKKIRNVFFIEFLKYHPNALSMPTLMSFQIVAQKNQVSERDDWFA